MKVLYVNETNKTITVFSLTYTIFISDTTVIGYIHNLSSLKTSRSTNNTYFGMQVQTADKTYQAVCFSAEKHKEFKARTEATTPVKLSKFPMKRNTRSNEDEIYLTKRSKLEEPKEEETNFDFKVDDPTNEDSFPLCSIETIIAGESSTNVTVSGRVTFQEEQQTVMTKGKTLKNKRQS